MPDEQQPTAVGRFQEQMLGLMAQFERERIAERALAGDPNPTDTDPLDYVRTIAGNYARHRDLPDADAMYLELANELSLEDLRALRLAGDAAKKTAPRAILAEHGRGMKPARIADELGVTESYVHRILREHRAQQ